MKNNVSIVGKFICKTIDCGRQTILGYVGYQ